MWLTLRRVIDGPFRGTEALAAGVLTAGQLRGPRFRRLFPDVYQPADLPLDLRRRSPAGYLLVRHHGGALAGYSAAVPLGADCAPAHAPVEVVLPGSVRRRPGLSSIRADLPGDDLVEVAGCRVTTAARTAWDLARRLPLVEAVVAVDALAHRGSFGPPELLVRAGLPRPVAQYRVVDEWGQVMARVDLAYPGAKLAWSTTAPGTWTRAAPAATSSATPSWPVTAG